MPLTDEQKHAEARKRGYPSAVFLPASIYRMAEQQGYDMTLYVVTKPLPNIERRA